MGSAGFERPRGAYASIAQHIHRIARNDCDLHVEDLREHAHLRLASPSGLVANPLRPSGRATRLSVEVSHRSARARTAGPMTAPVFEVARRIHLRRRRHLQTPKERGWWRGRTSRALAERTGSAALVPTQRAGRGSAARLSPSTLVRARHASLQVRAERERSGVHVPSFWSHSSAQVVNRQLLSAGTW